MYLADNSLSLLTINLASFMQFLIPSSESKRILGNRPSSPLNNCVEK